MQPTHRGSGRATYLTSSGIHPTGVHELYLKVRSSVPLPIRLRKIGVIQHDTMNDQRNQSTTTCSPAEEQHAMPAVCS